MASSYDHLIEKGWVTKEEFVQLKEEVGHTKFVTEDGGESFWGIPLSDDRFVLSNHPIEFLGCPPVVGMVGVYKELHNRSTMLTQETLVLFRNNGPAYLKYLKENNNNA